MRVNRIKNVPQRILEISKTGRRLIFATINGVKPAVASVTKPDPKLDHFA